MTFAQAQEIATRFGATPFKGNKNTNHVQCWIDRIVWLPSCPANKLADAVQEANRYA